MLVPVVISTLFWGFVAPEGFAFAGLVFFGALAVLPLFPLAGSLWLLLSDRSQIRLVGAVCLALSLFAWLGLMILGVARISFH